MNETASNSLQKQVDELLKQAEKRGVSSNFFFITTFKRYQVQMKILQQLEQTIERMGPIVEKEYVKGKPNIMANPAVIEYNKTATAANKTVATLIHIIKELSGADITPGNFSRLDDDDEDDEDEEDEDGEELCL